MGSSSRQRQVAIGLALIAAACLVGCGDMADGAGESSDDLERHYAQSVVDFSPGDGAGYGQDHLPEVALGPPAGADKSGPASDPDEVVSLGANGTIVLGFEDHPILDREGDDFIVFENPFWVGDDPTEVWQELGEVSVSEDGDEWHTFECDTEPKEPGRWPGCAGWTPTEEYDPEAVAPPDPDDTGGDAFDLADVDIERARYVRIRDLSEEGDADFDNVGFDLDAVGVIHGE